MASRVIIDILYICDDRANSPLKGVTALKLVNGKIEEMHFNVMTRIEKRNDIDVVLKRHDEVTLLFMEKELILRLSNDLVKVFNAKRSRGVCFEVVKPRMGKISILGGAKANIYASTKEIGIRHDSAMEDDETEMPAFISLLTRDEIDAEYDERRKRREERTQLRETSEAKVKTDKQKPTNKMMAKKVATVSSPAIDDSEIANQLI
jgi:hypothetical protein|uniref:Uncharacterized protein n=1 Tax=Sipha flava TaxID=143950 RepID=A0A2S2Q957_9HEMI